MNKRKHGLIPLFISLITLSTINLSGCNILDTILHPNKDKEGEKENTDPKDPETPGGNTDPKDPETPPVVETKPTVAIITDDILVYSEKDGVGRYDATLMRGDSYTINASLGDYQGTDYYLLYEIVMGEDVITLNNTTVSVNSTPNERGSAAIHLTLKQKSKASFRESITFIYFSIIKYEPKIDFSLRTDNKLKYEFDCYRLKLVPGDDYQLNPVVSGISDYTLAYEKASDYFSQVSKTGLITATNKMSFVGYKDYVYMRLKQGDTVLRTIIVYTYFVDNYEDNIVIDDMKPVDENTIDIVLTSNNDRVIAELNTDTNDKKTKYIVTYPYQGVSYIFPTVSLTNYSGDFTIKINPIDDCDIDFSINKDKTLFKEKATASNVSRPFFKIKAVDSNNKELAAIYARGKKSRLGPGEFTIRYGKDNILINEGDTIQVQKDGNYDLHYYYNEWTVTGVITKTSNNSLIGFDYGRASFKAYQTGQTDVTIELKNRYDMAGNYYDFAINFKIEIIDNAKPVSIYVPSGVRAFSISNNQLNVNGAIYVVLEGDIYRKVNNDEKLDIKMEDTSDNNVKKVTVSYTDKNVTVKEVFEVELSSSTGFDKTELHNDFYSYFNQETYHSITPLKTKGSAKILAVPIWFTDSSSFINENKVDEKGLNQKEQIREDIRTMLIGEDYEIGWKSLRNYYYEESNGEFVFDATVASWYNDTHSSKYYTREATDIHNPSYLAEDVISWYFNNNPSDDFSNYDIDNDGHIDSLILFYGSNYHGSDDWSRAFCSLGHKNNVASNFIFISALNMYNLSGMKDLDTQLNTNDLSDLTGGDILSSRTTIHEMGHMFGAFDLYDEESSGKSISDPDRNSPAGYFTMQDGNIGGHDPAQMMMFGWSKPYVFDSSNYQVGREIEITINDAQDSNDVVLLTNNWDNDNEIFSEYLVFDLYTPTGLNEYDAHRFDYLGANDTGIRLYHVNAERFLETTCVFKHSNDTQSSGDDYDFVHYIRNDKTVGYKTNQIASGSTFFKAGDIFDMQDYKTQFYKADGKLDNGTILGWKFEVENIVSDQFANAQATIKLIRI